MKLKTLGAVLLVATLASCGGDDDEPAAAPTGQAVQTAPAGPTTRLAIDAVEADGLSFSEQSLQVQAGTLTLAMTNPSDAKLEHAIAIEGGNGASRAGSTAGPGELSVVTVPLVAGDYTFYCPVGDHRRDGMEGTLVVE